MRQAALRKKALQKNRIMKYFIEAAHKILEEEGIEHITARKVADLAGYNSATLYNYFENLDHLICYASMGYLKRYYAELDASISEAGQPRDNFLKTWELFTRHSFEKPKIFKNIFFNTFNNKLKTMINTYFELFPEDFGVQKQNLIPMLREGDLKMRNMAILSQNLGALIPHEQLVLLNDLIISLYRGKLESVVAGEFTTIDEAIESTMGLITFVVDLTCGKKL